MKANYLKVKNIGLIEDGTITFDKPLIVLYGEIRQGKTTWLNCMRWVCGGEFPADIIRHGQKEAEIEFGFDGGMIRRTFYVSKKAPFDTKAREVEYVKNGRPQERPVAEIKRLLNPFLLNQDYLRNMGETDRKKYFTELFAVDTKELDTEAFNANRSAADLRAKLTGYGEIDLTPAEAVDVIGLKGKLAMLREGANSQRIALEAELQEINKNHEANVKDVAEKNQAIAEANLDLKNRAEKITGYEQDIEALRQKISDLETAKEKELLWISEHPLQKRIPELNAPDTTDLKKRIFEAHTVPEIAEIEAQISTASAQNVRAEQYQANKKRAEQKAADETRLADLEKRQRDIKAEKVKKLASISETCGIKELAFDESGEFTYQGTAAGMLSTSQIMRLSSELSALYPEGLGVELLDRGESLGKSIFDFVDRAKAEELTILATVVGEAPAKSPPEVGVFVVEQGKVKAPKQQELV